MLTNDFEDRQLIELWMDSINGGQIGNFHSRFHDDILVLSMLGLDKFDNVNYRCVMTDAFPVQLGVVNLSNESGDITKFNAQFRYRYWHGEFTNQKPSNLLIGFMDKHIKSLVIAKGKIEAQSSDNEIGVYYGIT